MTTLKTIKMVGVGVMAASLMAVAACGSGKNDEPAGTTTTATATPSSTVTSAAAAPESSAATSAPAETAAPEPAKDTPPAPAQQPAPAANGAAPELPAQVPAITVAPATNGRPGTDAEAQAITAMLKRQETATTVNEYFGTFVDSMCSEVLNEQGGPDAFSLEGAPDMPLASFPDYAATATKVTGVSGLLVEGDRATADVTTVTGAGQTATNTMAFRNEQGNWKLCR